MKGEDFLLKWNEHHSLFFAGAEELCSRNGNHEITRTCDIYLSSLEELDISWAGQAQEFAPGQEAAPVPGRREQRGGP